MPDFTGEFGGLVAMAFMSGIGAGWLWSERIRVKPLEKRLDLAESKQDAINSTLTERWLNGSNLP